MKICVYAISKNELKHIHRFCKSARDADVILIADTGSTDNTISAAKEYGAQVYSIYVEPWRFDYARTTALALVPKDVDVCVALDLDEVLVPGWRKEIERLWSQNKFDLLEYSYQNTPDHTLKATKVHGRNGWIWNGACHENLARDREGFYCAKTDIALISHFPDKMKPRNYLSLLQVNMIETPSDARIQFLYIRELATSGNYIECVAKCEEFWRVSQMQTFNRGEFCVVACIQARCYDLLGDSVNANKMFQKCCSLDPNNRYAFIHYATWCYNRKIFSNAFDLLKRALRIHRRPRFQYIDDPKHFSRFPYQLAALAAWKCNNFTDAVCFYFQARDQ